MFDWRNFCLLVYLTLPFLIIFISVFYVILFFFLIIISSHFVSPLFRFPKIDSFFSYSHLTLYFDYPFFTIFLFLPHFFFLMLSLFLHFHISYHFHLTVSYRHRQVNINKMYFSATYEAFFYVCRQRYTQNQCEKCDFNSRAYQSLSGPINGHYSFLSFFFFFLVTSVKIKSYHLTVISQSFQMA